MTMMMSKPVRAPSTKLRILSLSDVHLYHPRVPTEHVIDCLDAVFSKDAAAKGIDLIFIAGDLFDRGIPFGDEEVTPIIQWQVRFLRYCERHKITVRILYGTPRHDRKQSARFNDLIAELNIDVDFKYIDVLCIEYIQKFDMNVLYVPDEWRTESSQTLLEVKQEMAAKGLTQVDVACMHGCFGHQLPQIESVQAKAHNSAEYIKLVRYQIFIGHHHVFSTFDIICAHGSLTRLAQGEEAPKGYIILDIDNDDNWTRTFIENKDAWTFKTIKASDRTVQDVVKELREMNLRKGSYIDIEADITSECSRLFKWIAKEFQGIHMGLKRPKKKAETHEVQQISYRQFTPPQINPNNVGDHVAKWMTKRKVPEQMIQRCCEVLKHEQQIASQ